MDAVIQIKLTKQNKKIFKVYEVILEYSQIFGTACAPLLGVLVLNLDPQKCADPSVRNK